MHETELQLLEAMIADADPAQLAALSFAIHARIGEVGAPADAGLARHLTLARDAAPELFRTATAGVAIAAKATADILWPPLPEPEQGAAATGDQSDAVRRLAAAAGNDHR